MTSLLAAAFRTTGAVVGKERQTRRRVQIPQPERSTYVIGAHGVGKSTLLLNLILADIAADNKAVVVLDPHGDLAEDVLQWCPAAHAPRVVYFAPGLHDQKTQPFALNPFAWTEEAEYNLKLGAILRVFTHTWYGDFRNTPTLQNTLETLVQTLLDGYPAHQTSLLHLFLLLRRDELGEHWRRTLAACVRPNPAIQYNWQQWKTEKNFQVDTQSSEKKVNHLIANRTLLHVLAQPQSSHCFALEEMTASHQVLVVNLSGLDGESQRLLGSILLTQWVAMARLRAQKSSRIPCHIYADEFYNFAPQAFVTLINEMRKFGLYVTLAHQALDQLDAEARAAAANCGNKIVFQVNPRDAEQLRKHFAGVSSQDLVDMPPYQALVRYVYGRDAPRQAWVKTLPVNTAARPADAQQIRQDSLRYGTPVAKVDAIIEKLSPALDVYLSQLQNHGQPTSARSKRDPNKYRQKVVPPQNAADGS